MTERPEALWLGGPACLIWTWVVFCYQTLSIMTTIFQHENGDKCTCHQDILGFQLMINFVISSSDLQPYILDTCVKRWSELIAHYPTHQLMVEENKWKNRWNRNRNSYSFRNNSPTQSIYGYRHTVQYMHVFMNFNYSTWVLKVLNSLAQ